MKIIIMSSGDWAGPIVNDIVLAGFVPVAFYSKISEQITRKPSLPMSYKAAHDLGLKIILRKSLNSIDSYREMKALEPDLLIVVDYGIMLPQRILDLAKYGAINLHPSILPRWRGAAPIERALESGDKITGVSIVKMIKKLDAGNIIAQKQYKITSSDDVISLYIKLAKIASTLLLELLNNRSEEILTIINNAIEQTDETYYAKKINKSELVINWHESAETIFNKVRAFRRCGGANTTCNGIMIKILQSRISNSLNEAKSGTVVDLNPLTIQCGTGALKIDLLQRAGGNILAPEEFLRGNKIFLYDSFV